MRSTTAHLDAAHEAAAANRRWAPRKRVATPALVQLADADPVSCTIRNLSSSGALIETCPTQTTLVEVSGTFILSFTSARTRTAVACETVHRDGNLLGVRYVGPFMITDLAPPKPKGRGATFGRLGS